MTPYEQLKALNEAGRKVTSDTMFCGLPSDREDEEAGLCQVDTGQQYDDFFVFSCEWNDGEFIAKSYNARPALAELEKLMEPIGGLQESIFYFEKYLNECRANLQSQKQLADIQALNNLKSEPLWPVLQIEQLERVIDQMQSTLEAAKRFQQMSEGS